MNTFKTLSFLFIIFASALSSGIEFQMDAPNSMMAKLHHKIKEDIDDHVQDVKIGQLQNNVMNAHQELMNRMDLENNPIKVNYDQSQGLFKLKQSVHSQVLSEKESEKSGYRISALIIGVATVSVMM